MPRAAGTGKKMLLIVGASILSFALLTTACRPGGEAEPSPSATDTATPPAETASPSPTASPAALTGTGSLTGLVDNHSVEIVTENGPAVFQIDADLREQVEEWDEGTQVRFEYVKEMVETEDGRVEQLRLTAIDKQQ